MRASAPRDGEHAVSYKSVLISAASAIAHAEVLSMVGISSTVLGRTVLSELMSASAMRTAGSTDTPPAQPPSIGKKPAKRRTGGAAPAHAVVSNSAHPLQLLILASPAEGVRAGRELGQVG